MRSHLVAVVAYDDLCTFEFACAAEIFSVRWPGIDVPWYNFGVCAATRSPLRATGGVRFTAPHSLRLLDRADTIVIPGWRPAVPPPRLLIRFARTPRSGTGSSGVTRPRCQMEYCAPSSG